MAAMQWGVARADVEVAHLALDPAWVAAPAAAHAAATPDLGEQRVTPTLKTLRGE